MTSEEAINVLSANVIFACDRALFDIATKRCVEDALDMAIEALEEQRTGKWKKDFWNGWIELTCENCGYEHGLDSDVYGWSYNGEIPWKYCPNCGAKMEVDDG